MTSSPRTLLVVDDDPSIRAAIRLETAEHCEVVEAGTATEALAALRAHHIDAVLLDITLSEDDPEGGIDLLPKIRRRSPDVPIIMLTAHKTREMIAKALAQGARDYIPKPFQTQDLLKAIDLFETQTPSLESSEFLGRSTTIRKLRETARKLANKNINVLVLGETGSGKEALARYLHSLASEASLPFVAVNCAAIPSELLESTFFGHCKGAFTGASDTHPGLVERANGGILFLDEITSMPISLQAKVLRVLETGDYEPVGGTRTRQSRFRVITAANQDLQELVDRNEFREDLMYRISGVVLTIPPLRERPEDIALLINAYLNKPEANPQSKSIASKTRSILAALRWPGNVRQLFRTIDTMLALSDGSELTPDDIPDHVLMPVEEGIDDLSSFENALSAFERKWIDRALDRAQQNVSRAAKFLNISRFALYRRMHRLHMIDSIPSGPARSSK